MMIRDSVDIPKKLLKTFPNTTKHLKQHSQELGTRNSDAKAAWFEYGRSQALSHLNKEKLLISTIITNAVEIYEVDADTIPFSGIYITVKNPKYSLNDAIEILKSKQFLQYVQNIGINISGKSLRVTCKDINNYLFIGGQWNGKLQYIIEDETIAELLGVQNFSTDESAILELVKNAYDARASFVKLIFEKIHLQ